MSKMHHSKTLLNAGARAIGLGMRLGLLPYCGGRVVVSTM